MNFQDSNLELVLFEEDLPEPQLLQLPTGTAVIFSSRSPKKSTANEDAAVIVSFDSHKSLFAIADGCGGMAGGEKAARIVIETLMQNVRLANDESLRSNILDSFEESNQRIRNLGTGAATTFALVEFQNDSMRPYHAGDSSILLVGNHGKIKFQTISHSPVGYAMESGLLTEEEAIQHEERHVVSNVVGTIDTHIQVGTRRKMSVRDTVIIGSDGLFDNLMIEEIAESIRKGPLTTAARLLVELVQHRMTDAAPESPSKPDDLTFILFRRNPS